MKAPSFQCPCPIHLPSLSSPIYKTATAPSSPPTTTVNPNPIHLSTPRGREKEEVPALEAEMRERPEAVTVVVMSVIAER